jgi:D-alanyl-D-alanine carboxypeptidase
MTRPCAFVLTFLSALSLPLLSLSSGCIAEGEAPADADNGADLDPLLGDFVDPYDGEENVLLADPDAPDGAADGALQPLAATTVGAVARTACTTAATRGISLQMLGEVECLRPGTLKRIDNLPGVSLSASALPRLNAAAASALRSAASAGALSLSSATRSTAQQFVLYYWYTHRRCTNVVSLAAKPGRSNHESGLAIDVPSYAAARSRLSARGFSWLGSSDPVHFDYTGSGGVDLRPLMVKAFQRLWNRNHPTDRIAEDGAWGPQTSARMDKSPAAGFARGASCPALSALDAE